MLVSMGTTLKTAQAAVVKITDPQIVYFVKNGAVENSGKWLPGGISVEANTNETITKVRDGKGKTSFSSTGFVKVVPVGTMLDLPKQDIYISAAAIQSDEGDFFPILQPAKLAPTAGFNKYFHPTGQPRSGYPQALRKLFGARLNKNIDSAQMTPAERDKWTKIFAEMQLAANRRKRTPKKILMIDPNEAQVRSSAFAKSGSVFSDGAWTVAVKGTAKRYGFEETPCAEFVSEVLRQAYQRAGHSHYEDFNEKNHNQLDFQHGGSAVAFLAKHLNKAGWVPWEATEYIPPAGAIMMHEMAQTPGHTYLIAGDYGRFIVDNGSPAGRDLRVSSAGNIGMLYKHGVFFLPPGFRPKPWSSLLVAL